MQARQQQRPFRSLFEPDTIMSMAVSVPIVPSRLLRRLMQAYAAMCIGMGAVCMAGWLGPMQAQEGIAALCMLAGMLTLWRARALPTARRLDVCGPASVVLTVQRKGGDGVGAAADFTMRSAVQLLPESTLWPGLLVLRLRGPPDEVPVLRVVLVLLPDSVPAGEFRRLVVALRAVAGRAVMTVEAIPKIL
jgi:toxin CptA